MQSQVPATKLSCANGRRYEFDAASAALAGPSPARRHYLIIHLADQSYGLPLSAVEEIIPLAELSRPPACPAVLAGFLDLGGVPVPVIRLRHLFGVVEAPAELYTPLVLVRAADRRLALWVDRVSRTVAVDNAAIVPLGEDHAFNQSVAGLLVHREPGSKLANVLLLCVERLLIDQETRYLAELEALEQARLAQWREVAP